MITREEYIEQAEDLLSSAEAAAGRGHDSPSIEANAARATALSDIAHGYIALAQTASLVKAADSQTIIASEWRRPAGATPDYGTPTPPVHDETVSDAQDNSVNLSNPVLEIKSLDIQMTVGGEVFYTEAIALLQHHFPHHRVTEIDVIGSSIEATLEL